MHEPYEEDDDEYDDNEYNYDDNQKHDPYKFYFQFDVGGTPLSEWIQDMINDIVKNPFGINNIPGFPVQKFPVNSWNPNTAKQTGFQYLGSNYQGSPIWKKKYFVSDRFHNAYVNHLKSHAVHFLQQPSYYNGMFDILN